MKARVWLGLAAFGLSAAAVAGTPGNPMITPTGIPLIAPDSTGIWSIGGEALYMQQGSQFQYGNLGQDTPNQKNLSAGGAWDWGGELDLAYLFPGSSRDIRFAYTYLSLNSDDSVNEPGLVNSFDLTPSHEANSAKASNNETLNQADLVFGQWLSVGQRVNLHPFAGLRYVNLDADNTSSYYGEGSVAPASTNIVENDDNSSNLQGLGPRAGINALINLGNGFALVGTFAGSLIVGNINSHLSYNYFNPTTGTETTSYAYNNDIGIALVPELDANIGLNYHIPFNQNASMDLQAGYQLVDYFNAENLNGIDTFGATTTVPNSSNSASNFEYQGVYVRLQVNVA